LQAARWVREAGGMVGFAVEWRYPALEALTPEIDVYIASEDCYRAQHGRSTDYEAACRAVQARGPRIAVYTLGPGGSVGVADDLYFEAPGLAIRPVDTTGAGDVYHGAFLYGLAQGWEAPYVARFSNVVAAIKCLRIGGRAGLPDAALALRALEAGAITADLPGLAELDARVEFYSQLQV
jgi:sugar/nucleoside kinase (ribokinase family)